MVRCPYDLITGLLTCTLWCCKYSWCWYDPVDALMGKHMTVRPILNTTKLQVPGQEDVIKVPKRFGTTLSDQVRSRKPVVAVAAGIIDAQEHKRADSIATFSKLRAGTKAMLKVFRPNDWRYLGERSDGGIACRAALEEGFPKEKLAICRREVKLAPEVSLRRSANGLSGFVKGLQRPSKPKCSAKAFWHFCEFLLPSHL